MSDDELAYLAGSMFGAGSDTVGVPKLEDHQRRITDEFEFCGRRREYCRSSSWLQRATHISRLEYRPSLMK